jgi:hypothetical protein
MSYNNNNNNSNNNINYFINNGSTKYGYHKIAVNDISADSINKKPSGPRKQWQNKSILEKVACSGKKGITFSTPIDLLITVTDNSSSTISYRLCQ